MAFGGVTEISDGEELLVHATAIHAAGRGVLLFGASGSGKTSLAFGLIEALGGSPNAAFISDDQTYVRARDGRLLAHAPESIAGRAELHGYGIIDVDWQEGSEISLICELTPHPIERMPEPASLRIAGTDVPLLHLPARHEAQAIRIIRAWLGDKAPL